MKSPHPATPRVPKTRFRLGIVFLVLSYVFGWPFLLIVESIAIYLEDPSLGLIVAVIYGISWGLLGIAVLLSGPGVIEYAKRKYAHWRGNPPGEETT